MHACINLKHNGAAVVGASVQDGQIKKHQYYPKPTLQWRSIEGTMMYDVSLGSACDKLLHEQDFLSCLTRVFVSHRTDNRHILYLPGDMGPGLTLARHSGFPDKELLLQISLHGLMPEPVTCL
jgi:hypothetical protein